MKVNKEEEYSLENLHVKCMDHKPDETDTKKIWSDETRINSILLKIKNIMGKQNSHGAIVEDSLKTQELHHSERWSINKCEWEIE